MRRLVLAAGLGAALALGQPPSLAAPPRPLVEQALGVENQVQVRSWTYLSDGLKVRGRLYVPPGRAGRRPVVVFNHDGVSGISREHHLAGLQLARRGYVVFSPSYRGEDGSEGQVEIAKGEVRDVLHVLPLLASVPEADPERVVLAGASHGALISLLAAAQAPQVDGVIFAYGVADLYRWWDYLKATGRLGRDALTLRTYGDGPESRPDSFALRNGVDRVGRLKMPVLILQGEKDVITPPEQARILKEALDRAGVPNRLRLYPDALHGFLVYAPFLERGVEPRERQQAREAWNEVYRFLAETLGT